MSDKDIPPCKIFIISQTIEFYETEGNIQSELVTIIRTIP